jgi:hypothetical protein
VQPLRKAGEIMGYLKVTHWPFNTFKRIRKGVFSLNLPSGKFLFLSFPSKLFFTFSSEKERCPIGHAPTGAKV